MTAANKLSPKEIIEIHNQMLQESKPSFEFLKVFFLAVAVVAMWLILCLLTSSRGPNQAFGFPSGFVNRAQELGF